MAICVTGGTGYIGRRLVEHLVATGEQVRLLVRPGHSVESTGAIRVVEGDLSDKRALREAMEGCKSVFHLAAFVALWAPDPGVFEQVNIVGLGNVLEVAWELGVRRLVFTSSVRGIGPTDGKVGDEAFQSSVRYKQSPYECSKLKGEQLIAVYVNKGLSAVIVNPTNVFGPPALNGRIVSLLSHVSRGKLVPVVGNGCAIENYVYIDDVVEGHRLALEKGKPGERYILGGENLSFNALAAKAGELLGKRPFLVHLPAALLYGFASIQERLAVAQHREPRFVTSWVETFRHDWAYSSDKAKRELGYCPRDVLSGLTSTWDWIQEHTCASDGGR
jgi:farnesol dehydrogenase